MKKILLLLLLVVLLCGCTSSNNLKEPSSTPENTPSEEEPETNKNSIIVIYFSCTNNTENVANKIANYLNCTIEEIIPLNSYSNDDLNYNNNSSRANNEQNDNNARPEIKNTFLLDDYNTIFLGYPIWWGKLPKIIYTFLDNYNLDNYTIIPFCTSGGTGITTSQNEIKQLEPNANALYGKRFSGNASDKDIQSFIDSLNI